MATIRIKFGNTPFVTWKFVCKTPTEVKRSNRIAIQTLKSYLAGFDAALVSMGKKKNGFTITDTSLKPKTKGSTTFLFRPRVFRKPKGGGTDLTTSKVPRPGQPNP